MPRKKKRRSRAKPTDEYTSLVIRIDKYDVRAEAEINRYACVPESAWRDLQDEPLYHFLTHLEIVGTSVSPKQRAGEAYELTIYGEDNPNAIIYWKLKDVQVVDECRVPQYRTYRGRDIPVYSPPKGMGTLGKVYDEPRWNGALFVPPVFVRDVLLLLQQHRGLFMAISERKIERRRWIQRVSLQTTDPAAE